MSRIFINYRRQDSEAYVDRLYEALCEYFDRDLLFMDIDNIPPGVDFVQALGEAVAGCDVLLAVIGPTWLNVVDDAGTRRLEDENDFVRIEIVSALEQGKRVIPLLVGKASMPRAADLPEPLKPLVRRNALELGRNTFRQDIEKLAQSIVTLSSPRSSATTDTNAHSSIKPETPSSALKPRSTSDFKDSKLFKRADQHAERLRREAALKALRDDLLNATDSPLYAVRKENGFFPVLGEGSPIARLLFIGESPGRNEAVAGRPFIGPSGEVLGEMLSEIGLKREDAFVTNVLLDSPGEKRDPLPAEIAYYGAFLDRLIEIIRPPVLAPLGRFAMGYVLRKFNLPEQSGKISDLHGKLIQAQTSYGSIHIVPLYHPAVVLYSLTQKTILREDFHKLKALL